MCDKMRQYVGRVCLCHMDVRMLMVTLKNNFQVEQDFLLLIDLKQVIALFSLETFSANIFLLDTKDLIFFNQKGSKWVRDVFFKGPVKNADVVYERALPTCKPRYMQSFYMQFRVLSAIEKISQVSRTSNLHSFLVFFIAK